MILLLGDDNLKVLLDGVLNIDNVGANNLMHLLAVLVEHEGGHSADTDMTSDILHIKKKPPKIIKHTFSLKHTRCISTYGSIIHIDLGKDDVSVLVGELLQLGSDQLARAAPGGVEVNDDLFSLISANVSSEGGLNSTLTSLSPLMS